MSCVDTVRDFIRSRTLVTPGSRVLVAVSGGPDSEALLVILSDLSRQMAWELAAAHFDHGIRPESARERALVERLSARLSVPLFLGSGNVPAESRRMRKGVEETARLLRYGFLEATARAWRADAVALGHTRNDQVETILHHLIRGSGWRGLQGMPARRGLFVRPLLDCDRGDLTTLLRSRRIRYAIDRSNLGGAYLRNRLRNRLLPALRRSYNPSIDEALLRLSENLAEGWETLEQPLRKLLPAAGARGEVALSLRRLERLSDFQIYLFVDLVLRERFGVLQDIERSHFDAAKRLIRAGRSGKLVHFPHGIAARIEHSNLLLSRVSVPRESPAAVLVAGTGRHWLPWWRLTLTVERVAAGGIDPRASATEGCFASVRFPIRVRARRPGDRIVPFGMRGRRKLSDLFIDRKVPLSRRDEIPVLEDAHGIFWVPGVAADERTRIAAGKRRALRLKLFFQSDEK